MNYRLIHDGTTVLAFLEAVGVTETNATLFEGTLAQCQAEAARLGLADPNALMPQPYELSKYIILERLIAAGKAEAFLAAISQDTLTKARWDAATALDSNNPLLLAVRDQLLPVLGLTPEEATAILRPGREVP